MLPEAQRGRSSGDDQRTRRVQAHPRPSRQLHSGLQRTSFGSARLGSQAGNNRIFQTKCFYFPATLWELHILEKIVARSVMCFEHIFKSEKTRSSPGLTAHKLLPKRPRIFHRRIETEDKPVILLKIQNRVINGLSLSSSRMLTSVTTPRSPSSSMSRKRRVLARCLR